MLIYKMTHLPTGKFYIGSLQRAGIWSKYKTSSKIVRDMISNNPEEWVRVVLKRYPSDYDRQKLVDEEYELIDAAVAEFGWDGVWNLRGSRNLGSKGYSPEARDRPRASVKDFKVIAKAKLSKRAYVEANPDYFDRISATAKSTWSAPEMREYASRRAKMQFSTDESRRNVSVRMRRHLSENPDRVMKSLAGMKAAREDPLREMNRVSKIKSSMSAKSDIFSRREIEKHRLNPELGKLHGEKIRKLNREDPSRRERMVDAGRRKAEQRPDLVAKAVAAMQSPEAREKHKKSLLARYGKMVEVIFADGETIKIFGAKEAGRVLGVDKVSRKVTQKSFRNPLLCKSDSYLGREILSIRYVESADVSDG
jgi:hypothetical protein